MSLYIVIPIECTSRVTQNVNCGLCAILLCQCRFINCDKCTSLVENVDNGGGYACIGAVVFGKSLYPSLNYAENLDWIRSDQISRSVVSDSL